MRVVLVAALVAILVALSAGSGFAQTPSAAQTPADAQANLRNKMTELRQQLDDYRAAQMRAALGGLSLTADRMYLQSGVVYAEGNVTITLDQAVITADDAYVRNGEVQLGANARVRVSPK